MLWRQECYSRGHRNGVIVGGWVNRCLKGSCVVEVIDRSMIWNCKVLEICTCCRRVGCYRSMGDIGADTDVWVCGLSRLIRIQFKLEFV